MNQMEKKIDRIKTMLFIDYWTCDECKSCHFTSTKVMQYEHNY